MRIELLPKMLLSDTRPAFYDRESATAIEATAKIHAAINEVIADYNKFADEANGKIESLAKEISSELELFKTSIRQEFQDFIDIVDLRLIEPSSALEIDEERLEDVIENELGGDV